MPIAVIAGLVIVGEAVASPPSSNDRLERLRETEVEHLHRAVGPQLHIRGLEIAVDDPQLVGGFERFGDLPRNRERFLDGNRSECDAIGKRRPLDELEDERLDRLP